MSENIKPTDAAEVEIGTSKIGTFSQHIDASDGDVEAVLEALEAAGFDIETQEREGRFEVREDPYYVIHSPTVDGE